MIGRLRRSSLFWTFAGSFLAVLVVAVIVQGLVALAVVRPLSTHWMVGRAELLVREAASEMAATHGDEAAIREVMRRHRTDDRSPMLVFHAEDGRIIAPRGMPPPSMRRLHRALTGEEPSGDPPEPPPEGFRRGHGFGRGHVERFLGGSHFQVLATQKVTFATGESGILAALGPTGWFPMFPPGAPWHWLLFLPIAVLVAGIAGMILFRLLVRRLRALETLAGQVTRGDLSARISGTGSDEIGRLAVSLNRMTGTLAEARERIRAHDEQRRRLLADISHELATPLTSIRGYAETLLDPQVPVSGEENRAYLENVLAEAERMDLLIHDLFELTRLEAGANELVRERLDWTDLCSHTLERFVPRFERSGLALRWEGPRAPAWVEADGRRLEQVLDNLLVNALRYVPSGGTVVLAMAPAGTEGFRLSVADDGPGIPPEALPQVFDRFFRADTARASEGTGLGLAIVQEIVRRHGGSVSAEARTPRGTVFHVILPAAPAGD